MRKDFMIAVAVIAAGLIAYLTWRATDDGAILNTDAPQVTAPENAAATNPPAAASGNTQASPPQQ